MIQHKYKPTDPMKFTQNLSPVITVFTTMLIFSQPMAVKKNGYIDRMSEEHKNDKPIANASSDYPESENIVTA